MRGIIITGASSGLGAALALGYAASGVRLGLVGRSTERLEETAAACRTRGAEVEALVQDVAEADALGTWLLAFDKATPIDLVIANAGISASTAPGTRHEGLEMTTRQVRINLLGVLNTVEPLLPAMLARGRGGIAVISSVAGLRGLPYSPGYSASKAGVRAYGEALRALVAPGGVKVTVVCPGFFDTPMTDRWQGPKPFFVSLDSAAARIRRGIDRGARRVTFPWLLALGMRFADLMPPLFGDMILRDFHFHIDGK